MDNEGNGVIRAKRDEVAQIALTSWQAWIRSCREQT